MSIAQIVTMEAARLACAIAGDLGEYDVGWETLDAAIGADGGRLMTYEFLVELASAIETATPEYPHGCFDYDVATFVSAYVRDRKPISVPEILSAWLDHVKELDQEQDRRDGREE